MIWLATAICASIGFIQIIRWTQHAGGSAAVVGWVNYMLAGLFFVTAFMVVSPSVLHWPVIGLGMATGVLYINNYFLISAVVRRAGLGVTGATMALAVVMPVAISIGFGDPWINKMPGLITVVLAVPLVAAARTAMRGGKQTVSGWRRALWVLGLFFAIGLENTLIKVAREVGMDGFERCYLTALFSVAAVGTALVVLWTRVKVRSGDVVRGLLLGTCNILANYMLALAVHHLAGPVVFPLRLIGIVIGTTVLGRILWGERLNRVGRVGLALSIIAVILIVFADSISLRG